MPAPKNTTQENKPQVSLLPLDLLIPLLEPAYREGVIKYQRESWRLGFNMSTMMDAAQRHITAFYYGGEDYDEDALDRANIKKCHLGGAIFSLICMYDTLLNHGELDDRPNKKGGDPKEI